MKANYPAFREGARLTMPAPREAGAELAQRRSTAAGGEPRWWWSAGRRSAPEAGGSPKRIVLWRAPRPKRERVVTFARVAGPTTPAPPGAPLGTRVAFRANGFS